MPPSWLTEYWKKEKNWVKRYMQGAKELNLILCGLPADKETIWKKPAIRDFLKYMKENNHLIDKPTRLYRGSHTISPTMHTACLEMTSCQFMSTSKSLAIAKEFSSESGYIHVLDCAKGVEVYDFKEIYGDDPVKREKEVLVYPGCKLILKKRTGNTLYWDVTPPSK